MTKNGFDQLPIPGLSVEEQAQPQPNSKTRPQKTTARKSANKLTEKDAEKAIAFLGAWTVCNDIAVSRLAASILCGK